MFQAPLILLFLPSRGIKRRTIIFSANLIRQFDRRNFYLEINPVSLTLSFANQNFVSCVCLSRARSRVFAPLYTFRVYVVPQVLNSRSLCKSNCLHKQEGAHERRLKEYVYIYIWKEREREKSGIKWDEGKQRNRVRETITMRVKREKGEVLFAQARIVRGAAIKWRSRYIPRWRLTVVRERERESERKRKVLEEECKDGCSKLDSMLQPRKLNVSPTCYI